MKASKLKSIIVAAAAFVGALSASALELVTNGGFENGPYTGTDWTYCTPTSWSGGSGIQSRYTTTFCAATPYGNYCNFRASWASLSQTLDFPVAGTYRLSFVYTARSGYTGQTTEIRLGSKVIKTYTSSSTSWATMSTDFVVTAPGPQTLTFAATSGGDSALDIVSCTLLTPAETVTDCASWRQMRAVLEAGYSARLTKDLMQDSNGNVLLNGSQKVSVDLNGHKITSAVNGRLFDLTSNSAKLTITDSLGGGVIDGTNFERTTASGGCVKIANGCEFVFESGTIQNFENTGYNGGAIYNEGTTTMSGGMITNCVAVSHNGGGVYNANGTFNMTGGTIINCAATGTGYGGGIYNNAVTFNLTGGTIINCSAKQGGGIANIKTVNMSGGEIVGCTATDACGAILQNGTMTITGGLIADNYAPWHGGIAQGGTATTINGGTFTNNTSNSANGGKCLAVNAGTMTVNGGVFQGPTSLYAANGGVFNLYGGVFDFKPSDDFPVYGSSTRNIRTELQVGSKWVVGNLVATDTDKAVLTGGSLTFNPTNELYVAAGLKVADYSAATGSGTSWALKATNVIEVVDWETLKANLNAGNDVKLADDITQTSQQPIFANNQQVTLDLNGHTLTQMSSSYWVFELKSTGCKVTVKDSATGGKIVGDGNTLNAHGGCMSIYAGEFVLESGTLANFKVTGVGAIAHVYASNGLFTMNGGTITNCTAGGNGGAFYVTSGRFYMYGGTISGCSGVKGGAVYADGTASTETVRIYGGTIENCTASNAGGAIYQGAGSDGYRIMIYGGTFRGNKAKYGGVIATSGGKHFDIYGGVFTGNSYTAGGYGAFFDDASANRLCYLYSGVWLDDYNPTAGLDDTSLGGGRTCAHVGSTYVIGTGVAYHATTKQLTGGTYLFCPTNAEYVAAGLVDPTTVTVTV